MSDSGRYKANFTKGGLMVPESRIVAELLLKEVDNAHWQRAIATDNVLSKRSPSTAVTKARLIRARLRTDAIPIPKDFRHGWSEIIIWPLPADTTQINPGKSVSPEQKAKRKRRVPPPALAGKVRELGDVMSSASVSDWGLDE